MTGFYQNNKPLVTFLIRAVAIYLAWFVFHQLPELGSGKVDILLIKHLAKSAKWILEVMGFTAFYSFNKIAMAGIEGSAGLIISPSCNGLDLLVLFAGFIIAYPGTIRSKFLFIPVGLLIIDVLNIIRIVLLAWMAKFSPHLLEFNHSYTFTFSMYVIIFALWMVWIRKGGRTRQEEELVP